MCNSLDNHAGGGGGEWSCYNFQTSQGWGVGCSYLGKVHQALVSCESKIQMDELQLHVCLFNSYCSDSLSYIPRFHIKVFELF